MTRISKDPEQRKQELIAAARSLFMTRGYEQTSVSDIVKETKVAQGTFYYHFKSKIHILEAVLEKSITSLVEEIQHSTDRDDIDAVTKLNQFLVTIADFGSSNRELADFLHQDSNLIVHDKLAKMTLKRMVPLFSRIIQQGISEGSFRVTYPAETAKFLFPAMTELFHDPEVLSDPEHIEKARITVEQCLAGILGAEQGSFKVNL